MLETQVKEWVDVLRDYLWAQVVVYSRSNNDNNDNNYNNNNNNRSSVFSHFLEGIIAAIEGMKVRSSSSIAIFS